MKSPVIYDHPDITSFEQLLKLQTQSDSDKIAFQYMKHKQLISITYAQFKRDVDALASFFTRRGIIHTHIAVLGENSYEWILTYFSTVLSGNIIVPIEKELSNKEICALLLRAQVEVLVYSDSYSDVADDAVNQSIVKRTYSMKEFPVLLDQGAQSLRDHFLPESVNETVVCTIIFTSGTTGQPKGVMLTQKSMMIDAVNSARVLRGTGASLLTLPLYHTYAFTAGILGMLVKGVSIYISKSLRTFYSDMQNARPQNMILVPLYVETMYKTIWKTAQEQGKDKSLQRLITVSNLLRKVGIDLRRKLFATVLNKFGGELDLIVSGGAFLDQKYIDGMDDIGIEVFNGYGLTECSPVVATNGSHSIRKNSVGRPLPGNEVKIESGEICVKGDIVMAGYYQDQVATDQAIEDGWFKTGDLGYLDQDGFLYITGRKKNLIILSNGKNVSAEELETKILAIDGVQEVVVYAENDLITAEIFSADTRGIEDSILKLNRELSGYKHIQNVKFRNTEFPKTATKKIIRRNKS
jgi:long-chain acyl-CoA synthetase